MDTGVARKPIEDMDAYRQQLAQPARSDRRLAAAHLRAAAPPAEARRLRRGRGGAGHPRRRASRTRASARRSWSAARSRCAKAPPRSASSSAAASRSSTRALSHRNAAYADFLYERLQRDGFLRRDVPAAGQPGPQSFRRLHGRARRRRRHGHRRHAQLRGRAGRRARVIDPKPGGRVIGMSLVLARGRTVFVADTTVTEMPTPRTSPRSPIEAAGVARRLGYEPRVAFLAFSTFGNPPGERSRAGARGGAHPRRAARRLRIRRRDGGRRRAQPGLARRPIRSAA